MKHTTRLFKVTAVICLGTLLPGLLHATVIRQAFSYDASGRLTGVTVAARSDAGERYRYDASGNITEKSVNGETVIMTYDAANQLQTRTDLSGTTRFVYDNAGRLVEERRDGETIARYEYGYLDKVTSVTRDGVVTKFHYNARGMLVAKERDGKIIETLGWDGIGLVARGDTVFANEAHISGGVPLVATTSDGSEASYFDSDYLGTTTASYTADGEVNAYVQGSFGQGTEFADARFTGKHYDADLGAHVFPFRNYRSDAGRWTSADPAGFPDGPNQHFYAPVPTMGLDPWGLWRAGDFYAIPYTIPIPPGINFHTSVSDRLKAAAAPTVFGVAGFGLSKRAVEHLIAGNTEVIADIALNADEQQLFENDQAFQNVRNFVNNQLVNADGAPVNFADQSVTFAFAGITDMRFAIQTVMVNLTGTITPTPIESDLYSFEYSSSLNISFSDQYDFLIGDNALVNVFARLEANNWSSEFSITGNWAVDFVREF